MNRSVLERDSTLHFPHFIVLKASAGSGKTRTLTERFVQFILSDTIPKNSLRNILAVTFSNNAAKEMKERILLWLKALSFGDPESIAEFSEITSFDREYLMERGGSMIEEILENYPDFQVRTIDSFMTTVFKSSAIDFGYNPEFDILMNNDAIMEYAFNLFLRNVKEGTAEAVLFDTVIAVLNENKRKDAAYLWEPSASLLDEIKKIYRKLAATGKKPRIEEFTAETAVIKEKIRETLEDMEVLIFKSGLERSGKSTYKGILSSVREGRFADLIGKGLKTPPVNKVKKADSIAEDFYGQITGKWSEIADMIGLYTSFYVRSCFAPYLKVYEQFSRMIEVTKRRQGKVFIEDINRNLAEYLNREMVPDVYFRMGETIAHFLIDEFQDTSPVQWRNLFPLIENSLSQKGSAFVVGDTKQAIYGFRAADYTIMKTFESQSPFPSAEYAVRELEVNYRSLGKILGFNDKVFKEIVAKSDAYSEAGQRSGLTDFVQKVREGLDSQGYAEVTVFDRNDEEPPERVKIQELVKELRARGYGYRDIAILTQKNEHAVRITAWLNEEDIPFISYSSLDIRRRKITGEIVSLLNFLSSPTDDLSFASFVLGDIFAKTASAHMTGEATERFREFFITQKKNLPLYKAFRDEFKVLWETYFAGLFRASGYLPLYDLVTEIFNVFRVFVILEDEEATLVKILEVVKDFEGAGYNSLRDFLGFAGNGESGETEWNMNVPKNMDAVHVMTTHKAKGLGFPVVIAVLYEERSKGFDYIVVDDGEEASLLRITRDIVKSAPAFEALYREETIREKVNRLNSLYVGFTRPKEELYVIGVRGRSDGYPFDLLPLQDYPPADKPHRRRAEKAEAAQAFSVRHSHVRTEYHAGPEKSINLEERRRGEFIHRVLFYVEYSGDGYKTELLNSIKRVKEETGADYPDEEILAAATGLIGHEELAEYFRRKDGREIRREQ
ncbi:MAG: UvrD-helicase domain-containing protein, partial [Nitrospirota bacterium]|nr:UvrD-helicase domain-containing protein [Nitrospirota bacterium]